uniref:glucuronosyltransferase n=1 Tax=Panagrolaimus davidi TaxID=227884 RepID=A0A914PDZ2_9BILA
MSPSHLDVVFNVAEKYPFPKEIYDIRWPALDSVFSHPTWPSFKAVHFSSFMKMSKQLKQKADESAMERSGSFLALLEMMGTFMGMLILPCSLEDKYPEELKNASLALIDPFSYGCSIAVARFYNAKVIYVSPLIESALIQYFSGAPLPASYVMSLLQAAPPKMNFGQRFANIFAHGFFRIFLFQLSVAKFFYSNSKDIYGFPEPSLVLSNNHKFFDFAIPKTNAILDIANLEPKIDGKLDKEIENFMKNFDQIVLISFSTYSNDGKLPPKLYSIFVNTFRRFTKIGFIWRQKEELDSNPKNVLLVPWINQRAFLAHPKAKLLITHCGLNSVLEALNAGIPMIGIPTMGDQFPNSERIRHSSIGVILNLHTLSEETLKHSLKKILNPESIFNKSAKRLKEMLEFERNNFLSTDIPWVLTKKCLQMFSAVLYSKGK